MKKNTPSSGKKSPSWLRRTLKRLKIAISVIFRPQYMVVTYTRVNSEGESSANLESNMNLKELMEASDLLDQKLKQSADAFKALKLAEEGAAGREVLN